MRRTRMGRIGRAGGLGLGWLLMAAATSLAEVPEPQPMVADPARRSGLLSRYAVPPAYHPPDADRDSFEGTRFDDEHDGRYDYGGHRNSFKNGGLYGRPLPAHCTAAIYPFFQGSSANSICSECRAFHPAGRLIRSVVHQFRPIGMYYDRGVYVPIYDLDPTVPGPGPSPWPHFFKRPTGG